jgi:alpha-tubulin suppressor-like RCC1 family protein
LILTVALTASAATPQLVASENNAMALDGGGRVYSWGSDHYGQLGQGRILYSAVPRSLSTRTDIKTISAGASHSLMLSVSGDVYAWGSNSYGQLADGGTSDRSEPVKVFENAVLVDAGTYSSLVVDQSGAVWQAGWSTGNTLSRIAGVPPLAQVVTTGYNTIGLASDGSVWSWGDGQLGVLGFGKESLCIAGCVSSIRNIPGIPKIARLTVGYGSVMAIDVSGQVWAWGQANAIDGTSWNDHKYLKPTKLLNLANVVSISSDLVLFYDGAIATWFPGPTIVPTIVPTTERFTVLVQRGSQFAVDVLLSRSGSVWTYGSSNNYDLAPEKRTS